MTEDLDHLRARHQQARKALTVAEARFRQAELEDYELALDHRHSGLPPCGTPATDRAAEQLAHAIAVEELTRHALEDAQLIATP
jgi:hypothetical protein